MALLHKSELTPSKTEILADWARAQPWFDGDPERDFDKVAAFRFDDPEGRVGIETLFVSAGAGPVLQVPLTYRDTALAGGEAWLLGTMEHSVLGTRFVYDALGDPAYLAAVANAALGGGVQADEFYEIDGARVPREPTAVAAGSGAAGSREVTAPDVAAVATRDDDGITVASAGDLRVALARVPGADAAALAAAAGTGAEREVLSGSWQGHDEPMTLVVVARD
ncbi:maltokinase N-terminal cap-like domain-containing protein [Frondihabitans sucicola]|nr:hypothetical protein [Frondihabitans sucicola]